jgi:Ca-activated chloride channel family protein
MFNATAYENSRHDGIGVLEIVNHQERAPSQARRFVPLKRTELRGEAVGPLASLQLTQVYGYAKQQCDQVLEVVYRFPLPGDAAVTGVRGALWRSGDVRGIEGTRDGGGGLR